MKKITEAFAKLRVWQLAFLVNLLAAMLAVVPFLIRDHGYFAMSHDFTAQEIAFNIFMNDGIGGWILAVIFWRHSASIM